jgi:hypothetical protein
MRFFLSKNLILILELIIVISICFHHFGEDFRHLKVQGCGFKELSGLNCPSCGTTRSFVSYFRGNFIQSFNLNPIGFFIGLIISGDITLRILNLSKRFKIKPRKYRAFVLISIGLLSILAILRMTLINS